MTDKNKRFQKMVDNKPLKRDVEVMGFHKHVIPAPVEPNLTSNMEIRVDYGDFNNYPAYLLGLYANSSTHNAIINAKTTYINGNGVKYVNGSDIKAKPNQGEDMNSFVMKCIKDFLLFNYYAVEVIFNTLNQPIEYHWIPAQNVRTNRGKTKFWVNDDWARYSVNHTIEYDRFNPYNNTDSKSKIFFFEGYFPSINKVYPQPEYNGSIMSITNDIAIKEFNLNNITNQFSPSNIITFFMGSGLTDDVKRSVMNKLNESYRGTTGNKFVVDFQEAGGTAAEVKPLSAGDWDKAYLEVSKNVTDDICRGHQVTSPMLMGVKTEGQLGGATELETAYEIFKGTYVINKRRELESGFNILFTGSGTVQQAVAFTDKPLFNTQISDTLKEKIYTINELRKDAGLPALQGGDRLLSESGPTTPIETTPNTLPQVDENTDFKKKDKSGYEKRELTEEDFDRISHLGTDSEEFELVEQEFKKQYKFDKTSDVANFLTQHTVVLQTYQEIVDAIKNESGITINETTLKRVLQELQDTGIINISTNADGSINVDKNEEQQQPEGNKVLTMYAYILKQGVGGTLIIPTSRSFCRRVIENNKYYTREEIDTMSDIFGYDVYELCGGYYHDPSTGDTSKSCRHQWREIKVKRKTTNNN